MQKINVYCENCKYFKVADYTTAKIEEECFHEICFEPYQEFRIYDHRELNEGNKCQYYERKWWKIWTT